MVSIKFTPSVQSVYIRYFAGGLLHCMNAGGFRGMKSCVFYCKELIYFREKERDDQRAFLELLTQQLEMERASGQ